MSIINQQIEQIKDLESDYTVNQVVKKSIADKALVMVVGPSAVGKDYYIDNICRYDKDRSKVRIFATRDQRPDDDMDSIEFLGFDEQTVNELTDQIKKGELVNFAIHPTSGRIYGTRQSSFTTKVNYLPTLFNATEQLQKVGFEQVNTLGIVSKPKNWIKRFNARHPEQSQNRAKRIEEAKACLLWMKNHCDQIDFVLNDYDMVDLNDKYLAAAYIDEMLVDLPN